MSEEKSVTKEIYSGRAPWYNFQGENIPLYMIGITGGSASGKTTVSERIIKNIDVPWVVLLSMDSFYKVLTPEQSKQAKENNYNFDHPDSFDIELLVDTLTKLKKGIAVDIPIYDFKTHSRLKESRHLYGANVIVFEGIFSLFFEEIRNLMDLMLFIDTDSDVRLARRMRRDIAERGRDLDGVLTQYFKFVKPSFDDFIQPSKKYADVIIPRGSENTVALDIITTHIKKELKEHGIKFRNHVVNIDIENIAELDKLLSIPSIDSTIENKLNSVYKSEKDNISKLNEIFCDLSSYVGEQGLKYLPEKIQQLYQNSPNEYIEKICLMPISRLGNLMNPEIKKKLIPSSVIDQYIFDQNILIQTEKITGEPQLFECGLLSNIKEQYVFLIDAVISTGSVAIMAIRVLLDHNVKEENIVFLSLVSSPKGLYIITKTFPKVKIITLKVDQDIDNHINPFNKLE